MSTPRVPLQTPLFNPDRFNEQEITRAWTLFFERLAKGLPGASAGGQAIRTFLVKDATPVNDAGDHVPIYMAGTAARCIGVLRKTITADLTVRANLDGSPWLTITIPAGTAVDTPITETAFTPAAVSDLAILTFDITAGDSQSDENGIASFTFQWA